MDGIEDRWERGGRGQGTDGWTRIDQGQGIGRTLMEAVVGRGRQEGAMMMMMMMMVMMMMRAMVRRDSETAARMETPLRRRRMSRHSNEPKQRMEQKTDRVVKAGGGTAQFQIIQLWMKILISRRDDRV